MDKFVRSLSHLDIFAWPPIETAGHTVETGPPYGRIPCTPRREVLYIIIIILALHQISSVRLQVVLLTRLGTPTWRGSSGNLLRVGCAAL